MQTIVDRIIYLKQCRARTVMRFRILLHLNAFAFVLFALHPAKMRRLRTKTSRQPKPGGMFDAFGKTLHIAQKVGLIIVKNVKISYCLLLLS